MYFKGAYLYITDMYDDVTLYNLQIPFYTNVNLLKNSNHYYATPS